ncbi:YggU-like protein [Parathielavia hyrcaniae]|uniref:YggU-like protein n=1 Tax=Parathielavia hyrcaniae TaxID=113614 RepID=A0AAN6PWU7_9PEZI|nr:YggU-like protein [Parathielavia hyrcaniae]
MSARAIWYVAATGKSAHNTLYVLCNVKPGASKNREGIASVSTEAVEICVAAQAWEGEANKAVIEVLSETLDLPKSSLRIVHGLKPRTKTVSAVGGWVNLGEELCLRLVREHLDQAVKSS